MEMTEQQIILTLATKVMGWKRYGETEFWHGDNGNLFDSSLWNPLQNIADAWQVVEKLLEGFLLFDLSADEDGWWATFQRVDKTFIAAKKWEFQDSIKFGNDETCDLPLCKECSQEMNGADLCPHHYTLQQQAELPEHLRRAQTRSKVKLWG